MKTPTYSIVVPVHDEEETLPELVQRIVTVIGRLDGPAEVVMVDDGSRDGSYDLMLETHREDPRFKVLQLSRNFGHQLAITAGLDYARGDAVIVMDADLQDPPEVILDMTAKWREGYEVVYAVREEREGDSLLKRTTATLFYALLRKVSDLDHPPDVGDFRLVDRRALEAFRSMRERNRYVRGMFSWIGFKQTGVPFRREKRYAGTSKYPFRKMLKFAVDAIVGFSNAPLRFALEAGFLLAGLSVCYGIAAVALKLSGFHIVPGYASLLVTVAFLGGVQLIVIGMVGEYVARIYDEVRARPLYVLRDARGFTAPPESPPRDGIDLALDEELRSSEPFRVPPA